MFRYAWLLAVTLVSGCTSMQNGFCNLIDSDSYLFVSVAGCSTMHISFDYDKSTDFSALGSYDWMPSQYSGAGHPENQGNSPLHEWVTGTVDAKLADKGFRSDPEAPDFLVRYDVPVEMQGTLTLTFFQNGNLQQIWRGESNDEAYPARNQEAWETRIRTAAGRLLELFPPPRDE